MSLFMLSARWRRTGSTWRWSLTEYSSGCLYWCVFWDQWDSFCLPGWLGWSRSSAARNRRTDRKTELSHIVRKRFITNLFIFNLRELHVKVFAPMLCHQKVTHRETRWTSDSYGYINSLWGQKANNENTSPCHSILTLSRTAQTVTLW